MILTLWFIMINYVFFMKSEDDIINLITRNGYPAELHSITTEDSYILSVFRIPPRKPTSKTVIFMHGLLACCAEFLLSGPGIQQALAFKLADDGFDIWLPNARGSEFSRKHKYLLPTSENFWKFSWDEIAKYDLPATIDFILKKTNNSALHYVGHSQGTTVVMAMLSTLPQYNEKLKTIHLMGPAVYFSNRGNNIKTVFKFSERIENTLAAAGLFSYPAISLGLRKFVITFCSSRPALERCKRKLYSRFGFSKHFNEAILKAPFRTHIFRYFPNTASVRQGIHYAQIIGSGGDRFLHFNHGREKNILKYNQSTPPIYQLSNVKAKIHFLYGTTDESTAYQDVERLIEEFKPWTIGITKLNGYNHLDFVAAKDIDTLVNEKILNLMNRYNN